MSGRIIPLFLILFLSSAASAATWVVHADGSGDVPTIQAAIDALEWYDVIELSDGVYTGYGFRDLTNYGKAFAIVSQSGDPTSCIIDCQGTADEMHFGVAFYGEDG